MEVLLHLLGGAGGTPGRVGLVPLDQAGVLVLVVAGARDRFHQGVARDRDGVRRRPVGRDVHQDGGVGAVAPGLPVDRVTRARAGVRAEHQDVQRLCRHQPVLLRDPLVVRVVDLFAGLEIGIEMLPRRVHDRRGHQRDHDLGDHHDGDQADAAVPALRTPHPPAPGHPGSVPDACVSRAALTR